MQAGAVQITMTFLSPVEPQSPELQSIPLSYLTIEAVATDGNTHSVQIQADISAEWTNGDSSVEAQWTTDNTTTVNNGTLQSFTVEATNQEVFAVSCSYIGHRNLARLTRHSPFRR